MKDFVEQLSREAGELALEYRRNLRHLTVDRKSAKDLVTEADKGIEQFLVRRILERYPGHAISGEETGNRAGSEYRWIIDPIDGTASFVHDQPYFSVSIALEKDGETILGAVHAPALQELYLAELGGGATCNGVALRVSPSEELVDSMLATGFACLRANAEHNNLPYFNAIIPQLRDIRRYGSAAVDLCYVAAGRIEGFWELGLHDYDVAAGLLMVTEAGGCYTDLDGGEDGLVHELLATNGAIHQRVLEVFRGVRAGRAFNGQ